MFDEEGNVPPISNDGRAGIARLLARALNRNQRLILNELAGSDGKSLTSHIRSISATHGVPISTLKLNAKILTELQLIKRENRRASLSASGNDTVMLLRELDERSDQLQGVS